MSLFDPARPEALPHAGTFNNNVASMAAGHAGLHQGVPARGRRAAHGPGRRAAPGTDPHLPSAGAPLPGHRSRQHPRHARDHSSGPQPPRPEPGRPALLELLFLDLLEHGYYIAPRGYLALSLALTPDQLTGFVRTVGKVLDTRAALWARSGEQRAQPR